MVPEPSTSALRFTPWYEDLALKRAVILLAESRTKVVLMVES
jgi:hypothetical protein